MSNYLVSIDWLQYYCHRNSGDIPEPGLIYIGKHRDERGVYRNYTIQHTDKHSHVYIYNFAVIYKNMEVAYIGLVPRTPILSPDSASVKIANHVLYKPDWAHYVTDICSAFDLTPRSITRMDLAYDCKRFKDGYLPNKFIQDYIADSINDEGHCIVRERSNKFYTVCSRIARRDDEENPKHITGFYTRNEYLRWGTRDSGTCVYLYNKSLELRQSGDKQYIKDAWARAGMDPTDGDPIYRVEISIKAKSMNCERSETPRDVIGLTVRDISALALDDINSQAKLENVFFSYAQHYFAFRKSTGQHYIKDMERMELLERTQEVTLRPRCLSRTWNIGTSERRAAATIRKFVREYPDMPLEWRHDFGRTCDALDQIAGVKLAAHVNIVDDQIVTLCEDVFATDYLDVEFDEAWSILTKQARATKTQKNHLMSTWRGMLASDYAQTVSNQVRLWTIDNWERMTPLEYDPYDANMARMFSPRHYEAMYGDFPQVFYTSPRSSRLKCRVS